MPANFVALSDLHLGYDATHLNDPVSQLHLVNAIGDISNGVVDRFILNGDAFEACVPRDAGHVDALGFSPFMSAVSKSFFSILLSKIQVNTLVLGWGNHDYCMWDRLANACGVSTFTNNQRGGVLLQYMGNTTPGAENFLNGVIGPSRHSFQRIRVDYPNYFMGTGWPIIVFHHGHLMDPLILGWEKGVDYVGLASLIGSGQPQVSIDEGSFWSIHQKTSSFLDSLYKYNSLPRNGLWSLFRRFQSENHCPYFPQGNTSTGGVLFGSEPMYPQLGNQAKWYTDLLALDPTTPGSIIGSSKVPSYLFIGHDHAGGFMDVQGMDGHNWKVVNLGGWTSDRGETDPHQHLGVWLRGEDAPRTYCVRV